VRAEQTVSEMVTEALARQAEALAEDTGRPFEDAFADVLETPRGSPTRRAGRRPAPPRGGRLLAGAP
jgi:hypothetical protein